MRWMWIGVVVFGSMVSAQVRAQVSVVPGQQFGWTMTEDVVTAQAFTYKLYSDAVVAGVTLTSVVCVNVSVGRTDCTVKIPAFTPGAHTVRVTASNGAVEGPKSDPLDFTLVAVPSKPTSLKVQ